MSDLGLSAPAANRAADRVALAAAAIGGVALVGAGLLLWGREGLGVFVEVILAGLSACF